MQVPHSFIMSFRFNALYIVWKLWSLCCFNWIHALFMGFPPYNLLILNLDCVVTIDRSQALLPQLAGISAPSIQPERILQLPSCNRCSCIWPKWSIRFDGSMLLLLKSHSLHYHPCHIKKTVHSNNNIWNDLASWYEIIKCSFHSQVCAVSELACMV